MKALDTNVLISGAITASLPLTVGGRAVRCGALVHGGRLPHVLPGIRDGTRAVPYSRFTADHSSFRDVEGGSSSGLG